MTRNYYTSGNYKPDHSTFGGLINPSDFDSYYTTTDMNGYHTMKNIADRIVRDWTFDNQCRKNIQNRNKQSSYKKAGVL